MCEMKKNEKNKNKNSNNNNQSHTHAYSHTHAQISTFQGLKNPLYIPHHTSYTPRTLTTTNFNPTAVRSLFLSLSLKHKKSERGRGKVHDCWRKREEDKRTTFHISSLFSFHISPLLLSPLPSSFRSFLETITRRERGGTGRGRTLLERIATERIHLLAW
jgi:hypothetical protein